MTKFSDWVANQDHVAIVLKQILVSVEGKDAVIFPPTYADAKENYNIDTLSDGRRVVTIDSEGAQANRMEPMFKTDEFKKLVPQISIDAKGQIVSLLDAGHRLGDALIRSTPLGEKATEAFEQFLKTGDATLLGQLAPTSLVFGVWDSRGTGAKLPRIVRSVVRGWDVDRLTRSAQYTPAIDYLNLEGLFDEADKKKLEGDTKSATAQLGYVHVPAPGGHGGVLVRGEIVRDVTVNLIALRRLRGADELKTQVLRSYILALALIAAREEHDGFYRQGCLLVPEGKAEWQLVSRTGEREVVTLDKAALIGEASAAKEKLKVSEDCLLTFSVDNARREVKAKNEEKVAAAANKKAGAKK